MNDVTLLAGDCLEMMQQIPSGSISMILTDPPYSSGGLFVGDRRASTGSKYTDNDFDGAARFPDFSGDNMDQRSFTEFMRQVFFVARTKTQAGGIACAFVDWRNLPAMTDAIQAAGWIWRGIAVWDKGISRNIPGRYRNDCEYAVWGTNGPRSVDWTPGFRALPGYYRVPSISSKKKHHQTEKPVDLLIELL